MKVAMPRIGVLITKAVVVSTLLTSIVMPYARAQEEDLTELSLEELLDVEITTVSKKSERRSAAAAAVYVLSSEDIARTGATHVADVLRGVPGLSVARLDGNKWSVSSRGFGGVFANKLLVLVDGRSIYTPLFSGVYWDQIGMPLEDIERIEVIRGPGSTVWGANAVNGVINIVTKSSADTLGGLFSIAAGNELRADGSLRFGFPVGDKITGRIYTRYHDSRRSEFPDGSDANDDWWHGQGGLRLDWNATDEDSFVFHTNWLRSELNETISVVSPIRPNSSIRDVTDRRNSNDLLGRWTHRTGDDSQWHLQMYYSNWEAKNPGTIEESRDIFDIDFQHRFALGTRHDIVWGAQFRYTEDEIFNTRWLAFDPTARADRVYSAFIQDEITLVEDRLKLTIGSKFEHNSYTGFEAQPSARIAWTPNTSNTLWASISRAVRTPSRAEADTRLPSMGFPRVLISLIGSDDFESEDLWAYEIGYRASPRDNLLFDIALFYNDYSDLRTVELDRPEIGFSPFPVHLLIPARARNNMEAQTYGAELAIDWRPVNWWRTHLSYSYLNVDLDIQAKTFDIISAIQEGDSPEHQVHWTNNFQLTDNVEFATTLRYVDELSTLGVDDYFEADARIAWKIRRNMEFALVGTNLLETGHTEFAPTFVSTLATEVQRSIYGKFTWTF